MLAQVFSSILLLCTATCLHIYAKPYTQPYMNRLEGASLASSLTSQVHHNNAAQHSATDTDLTFMSLHFVCRSVWTAGILTATRAWHCGHCGCAGGSGRHHGRHFGARVPCGLPRTTSAQEVGEQRQGRPILSLRRTNIDDSIPSQASRRDCIACCVGVDAFGKWQRREQRCWLG